MIGAALDAEYERLSGKSASDIARARLGASDLERFLIDAGVAGAQIAADTAAYTLLPGAGIALKGVRSFGDASQEAHEAGASIGQQVTYGGLTAGKNLILEKAIDGLVGTYGKGLADKAIKEETEKAIKSKATRKKVERLIGIGGEALGEFASGALDPLIERTYNEKTLEESYTSDVWLNAARDAAINGLLSGTKSAWADAQDRVATNAANALNKAAEANNIRNWQKTMRNSYVVSTQYDAESYASLIRMLMAKKGDGRRW